jgi:hypothetical protein
MNKVNFMTTCLLLAAATLAGCKDDEAGEAGSITVESEQSLAQELFADETEGKAGVSFTTAGAWSSSITTPATKAGEGDAWVSISPDHGDRAGTYTIAISLEPNFTRVDRAATIHIVCGDTEIAINVAQKGVTGEGEIPVAGCDILSFSIGDGYGWDIDGQEITRDFPAAIPSLVPVIELSPGATVDPPSGQPRDFFVPGGVTYTVTAGDGKATKTYTARATITPVASGATGQCAWKITGTPGDYTLEISGNGAMADHDDGAPWGEYLGGIKTAIVRDGVTTVGVNAFGDCAAMTSVTLPASVNAIGRQAFAYCSGLTAIDIPGPVTAIASEAFTHCDGLASVTGGNSVREIGDWAFAHCGGLTSVPGGAVTKIGNHAFYECTGLASVTLPPTVETIGERAFVFCSGMTSLVIGNAVTGIGDAAFSGCEKLASVTIGSALREIGMSTFADCAALASITIPNTVEVIGDYAFSTSGLVSVTIGSSVREIGNCAFSLCEKLASVDIPGSVEVIGEEAFSNCTSLASASIGSSVNMVHTRAFLDCGNLATVTCRAATPPATGHEVFAGIAAACTLRVPAAAVDAYRDAPAWGEFDSIEPV